MLFKFAQFWQISSFASHDSRGFQLTPNGIEFENKVYGESYNIKILPIINFDLYLGLCNLFWG